MRPWTEPSSKGVLRRPAPPHRSRMPVHEQCYQKRLKNNGLIVSMSGKGDCWDNAVAESFFATLKIELGNSFSSRKRLDLLCSTTSRSSTTASAAIPP